MLGVGLFGRVTLPAILVMLLKLTPHSQANGVLTDDKPIPFHSTGTQWCVYKQAET